MSQNKLLTRILAGSTGSLLLAASGAILAQPTAQTLDARVAIAPPRAGAVESLADMQSHTALIKAQIEQIKAQTELQAAHNQLRQEAGKMSGDTVSPRQKERSQAQEQAQIAAHLPQVLSIYGTGKRMYASLRYPSGLNVDVRAGERLDGDYVVKSISSSRVTIERGAQTYVLPTWGGAGSDISASLMRPN